MPARFALFILAMEEEMEKNTIGTTTQNIMLINSVPSGSRTPELSQVKPTTMPSAMPRIMEKKNQLFFRKLLDFMDWTPFRFKCHCYYILIICKVNCNMCLKDCKSCAIIIP